MEVCYTDDILQSPAAQRLRQFVRDRAQAWHQPTYATPDFTPDFEEFERALHAQIMDLERELIAAELARYDVAAAQVEIAGVRYAPVLRTSETYLCAAGPVRVTRHLYRPAGRNTRSVCPLELRAGVVAGYWTPRAARLGAFVMAQLTPGEAQALFAEWGAMQPSRSTLQRLPHTLSAQWEPQRAAWEAALRSQETVPPEAATVALSVDGVMAPLKAGAAQRQSKRQEAGKHGSGPAGYREVGCGTLSLYDAAGERLETVRYGRMPESKKLTLQGQLQAEVQAIVALRPDLRRVYLADGADSNWQLLRHIEAQLATPPAPTSSQMQPVRCVATTAAAEAQAVEIVDFYHACDHLKNGCDAVWGESTPRAKAEFERFRTLLKEQDDGAECIIRSFKHHASRAQGNRQQRITAELTYFRNQRPRMRYAQYQRDQLPIASGVMEAACKTLVAQRLKRSGMAWSMEGGQAILTLRSLLQSARWPQAWRLLASSFRQTVEPVNAASHVVAMPAAESSASQALPSPGRNSFVGLPGWFASYLQPASNVLH